VPRNLAPSLKTVNRHITIVLHRNKKEKESAVLLPEDFKPREEKYVVATAIDVAPDCSKSFQSLRSSQPEDRMIVIDRTMVEEIKIKDKKFFLILENYVVGFLKEPR